MPTALQMNSSNKRPHPDSSRSLHITPNAPIASSADVAASSGHAGGHGSASSAFRNVSACNRCRLRKNRCDQNLPACSSCEKANVKCVGYDPITKREIPRAYVYYLESRVAYLEDALRSRNIPFPPADDFGVGTVSKPKDESQSPVSPLTARPFPPSRGNSHNEERKQKAEADKLNKLVSNIGMVSVQGTSDPRFLGSTSGISFARVVFAAVRNSISGSTSERTGIRPGKPTGSGAGAGARANFRDSFFGLQSKPDFRPAPFPDRELGARLVNLYFEHANPQIPILHRGEFMQLFERTYATEEKRRGYREQYMLYIVFAIGAGTLLGAPDNDDDDDDDAIKIEPPSPRPKRLKLSGQQYQAEEYHAAAMVHLGYFLSSSPASERPEGFGGSLEELQAVLLLAGFALLRPIAPGLWYICGVAMRLAVDLGLHYEDGTGVEDSMAGTGVARSQEVALEAAGVRPSPVDAKEKGRREWVRDLRRRLWWCAYTFDRLVSVCVGRPFGITDQVVTTEFPSILDDNYITKMGFSAPAGAEKEPSYKRVAHHYFRLRLLQSEILQVLQYRQARHAREKGRNQANQFMHTKLPSPFLDRHEGFQSWRRDIDRRLWEWKESAPRQRDTTVSFSVQFLELNYWQAVIMLYRQSLTVPPELDGEVSPSSEISSPMERHIEDEENDDVFLKVAEAGQKVLKLYYQLHKSHVVNYTYLATHHLFMAGIAFLYAIWHSPRVRELLTHDDVDYTVLAGTTVLRNLTEKCPPADACRDAFDRMAKATIHMCLSTTGFGQRAPTLHAPHPITQTTPPVPLPQPTQGVAMPASPPEYFQQQPSFYQSPDSTGRFRPQRPRPQFDMNLRDLFPDETTETSTFRQNIGRMQAPPQRQQMPIAPSTGQFQYGTHSSPSPVHSFSPPTTVNEALSLPSTTSPPGSYASNNTNQYNSVYSTSHPTSNPGDPVNDPMFSQNLSSDLDALLGESNPGAFNGNAGLSLGFDQDHDWNDGWGPDLFEGFWFGGWNGGGMGGFGTEGVGDVGMMDIGDRGDGQGMQGEGAGMG